MGRHERDDYQSPRNTYQDCDHDRCSVPSPPISRRCVKLARSSGTLAEATSISRPILQSKAVTRAVKGAETRKPTHDGAGTVALQRTRAVQSMIHIAIQRRRAEGELIVVEPGHPSQVERDDGSILPAGGGVRRANPTSSAPIS